MRLQVLVPVHGEPWDVVKPLLDSIAMQQNVDFGGIGAVLVSDGPMPEWMRDGDFKAAYPFAVECFEKEPGGVSAARNCALDHATADYVMFCDADDMFCNAMGLFTVFQDVEQNGDFDTMVSVFMEETRDPQDKSKIVYVPHQQDSTFVHGKVHRRQYLVDKQIRFDDRLTVHEDSYFNILAQELAGNGRFCPLPFYLWKWRDESVCRHDPKYILKTYGNMLDSNDALVDQFVRRGVEEKARFFTGFMIYDAYYAMNKPEWAEVNNAEYRDAVERRFGSYFRKHRSKWAALTPQERVAISNGVRQRSVMEGMLMEAVTLDDWLARFEGGD